MWPWEHLALGYLPMSITWRISKTEIDDRTVLSMAFGTQFPDLVDKPLAWYLSVLPAARSLTHSLLVAVPLSLVVLAVAVRRRQLEYGIAFVLGYVTHLFGDALPRVLVGYYEGTYFLLWPLLPLSPENGPGLVLDSFYAVVDSPATYVATGSYRTAIIAFVVVLWATDGFPGLAGVGRYITSTARKHMVD